MRFLLPVLTAFAIAGCSSLLLSPEDASDLVLVNHSGHALLYLALELQSSHPIDPNPSWRVAEHKHRLIEPGAERAIEVEGYTRGKDVRLFLYKVGDRNGEAPFTTVLTVTDEQLRESGYRIRVTDL